MLQLFDSIRKRKARIAVMIVAALVCSLLGGFTAAPMAKAEETGEEIYTPDRVDLIAPVEGAVFLEEKDVLTGLEVTETTTDSITVAWDEMPGMTSYLVYYYDFEKSAYVFLDETKEQKYTWKDRKAGDEFYITVCLSSVKRRTEPLCRTGSHVYPAGSTYDIFDHKKCFHIDHTWLGEGGECDRIFDLPHRGKWRRNKSRKHNDIRI